MQSEEISNACYRNDITAVQRILIEPCVVTLYCGSAEQCCEMETITLSWDPLPSSYYPPTFCYLCFSPSNPCGSEPEGGRRPPPLGGKILSIFTLCACFQFIFFNICLQDQKFLPKNFTAGVFWCSLITFKLISKQQNKNAVPSNPLSNSLAVLE